MKYCKHYLLFFLSGALLLLPVTSHYAISWEEIKKKARTFVSEDGTKFMPAAVVAVGLVTGGLYYWWMSRGITKSIRFSVADRQVTQFPIYSQFSLTGGGGAASCGYHTLLRGMQVINGVGRGFSSKQLEDLLMEDDAILYYFNFSNPLGVWREQIIQRRKIVAIAELLKEKLFTALREEHLINNYDPKILEIYRSVINRDIKPELIGIFERDGSLSEYEFRAEDFKQLFMKTDFVPEDRLYAEKVKESDTIDAYLDLDRVANELSNMHLPTIKDSNNGDWLQGNELEFLWEKQLMLRQKGQDIISNDISCGFTPVDDFNWIGKKSIESFRDENGNLQEREVDLDTIVPPIKQKLNAMVILKRPYFHLFGIGTMEQSGDAFKQAGGHWFALILYQHSDGNREYFVTDSFNNVPRNNDARVMKLIRDIENQSDNRVEEI